MEYCGRINNIKGVDHKNSQMITVRYLFSHRKHRYELVDETKKQPNRILVHKELANKVIMDYRIQQHKNCEPD